ncbi:MAG: CDP-diacylglycerol--serine O-phosphatidyltransferase [Puniceicoccales bacterium]|jgi:CDP-diacylglycerol--serine O-phosphatidyltransferase|nr:CDP-diacylglycerol--serine O-phosphatidyltransferase [Puniceicoccales bacterium]
MNITPEEKLPNVGVSAQRATDTPKTISPKYHSPQEASRIFLLPNLFTAGNMLCGFLSIHSCISAKFSSQSETAANILYQNAVYFILGACICDLFDGRVARIAKRESLFGAEFDSLADIVSFGMAPALMVCFLILDPSLDGNLSWVGNIGKNFAWVFAFIYLLCVGVRLARFNVLTNPLVPGNENKNSNNDFVGLPCPIAAGMIASIVLLLINANLGPENLKKISTLFLPITLLISYLMVSNIRYPSFKHINWNTRLKIQVFISIFLFLILTIKYFQFSIPLMFLAFILNGIAYSFRKGKRQIALNLRNFEAPEIGNNPEDKP